MTAFRDGLRVTFKRKPGITAPGHLVDKKGRNRDFVFRLPPLDEFSWEESATFQDWGTVKSGEFSRFGGRALRSVSWQQLVLDYDFYAWTGVIDRDMPTALEVLFDLRELQRTGTPFIFVASNPITISTARPVKHQEMVHLDMYATLRSIKATDRAGEPDSLYFNIDVKEYRLQGDPPQSGGKPPAKPTAPGSQTKVVYITRLLPKQRTLRALSIMQYGNAYEWRRIVTANPVLKQNQPGPNDDLMALLLKRPALQKTGGRLVLPGRIKDSPGTTVVQHVGGTIERVGD